MKKPSTFITIGIVLILLAGLAYRSLSTRVPVEEDSGYRLVMGTFSRVVVIAKSRATAKRCIEAAFDVENRLESLLSDYQDDSELSKVNREAAYGPVPVSALTFEALQKAVYFHQLSGGVFDVTVGPLVDLWHKAGRTNELPTEEALAEARRKVGSDKLILDEKNRTVRFVVEGMRVDLGGIGKGYAADKAVEAMKEHGALGGMVALAGDIRCFGQPPRGQAYWRIGVQDPNVAPDDLSPSKPLLVLALTSEGVSTSGDYRRFVRVQGQKQSHIIDPGTGKGANKLVSDTIIAPDTTTSDALSTAVNVLGLERGLALVERLPTTAAILIPAGKDAQPIFSSGAKAYVVPPLPTAPQGKK